MTNTEAILRLGDQVNIVKQYPSILNTTSPINKVGLVLRDFSRSQSAFSAVSDCADCALPNAREPCSHRL